MKRILPKWCKDAKKAMIDKDMSVEELAQLTGRTSIHFSCTKWAAVSTAGNARNQ